MGERAKNRDTPTKIVIAGRYDVVKLILFVCFLYA